MSIKDKKDQVNRVISTSQLHMLPYFHTWPINVVVFHDSHGRTSMPLARQQVHQRYVHPGPLVLGAAPLNSPTITADRDRTVSRRSKPSSRTALIGEQPNPWDLLQPQDAMSRHVPFIR